MDEARWGDVYLSSAARGVSVCGDFLAATALTLVLARQGAGGYVVAALLLAAALPPVLFARPAGRIADRLDSRLVLASVAPAQALCCVAMLSTSSPVVLILLNAVLATGVAITQPVLAALVPAMVGVDNVPRANAVAQTATSAGMLLGPVLAGLFVGGHGLRVPLLLDAASFLAIAVMGAAVRTRRNQRPARGEQLIGDRDRAGVRGSLPDVPYRLRQDRPLALVLALAAVVVAAANLTDVAIVFFVRRTLDASAAVYGVVMAGWMLGLVPGSWLAAHRKTDDRGYFGRLGAGLLLVCAAVLATGAAPSAGWVLGAFVVGGVGNGLLGSAAGALVARRTSSAARGMGFARLGAVMNGAMATGYVLGGALLGVLSPRLVILTSGASALVLVVALSATARFAGWGREVSTGGEKGAQVNAVAAAHRTG